MAMRAALLLLAVILAGDAAAQTASSWLGGTGVWSDPARWSSSPLYPCNGNGGQTFDVTIASGSATLDLDCAVQAFDLSGGTLDGGFELTANGLLTWSTGTMAGAGTTRAIGGVSFSSSSSKVFTDTRTLALTGGSSSWSAGAIALGGGGATLHNQLGSVLEVTGASGRSLNDSSDSGRFLNDGVFSVALATPSALLTLSPGTLTNSNRITAATGILSLAGSGAYTGAFDGAGTLRFSGGTQELLSGASVATSTVGLTGGDLSIRAGASFGVSALAISNGTLSVVDPSATASAGATTFTAGTLTGAGSFTSSGPFTWASGTMSGSGETQANGGLVLSGGGAKVFAGTRTLRIGPGASSWLAGNISLGSEGAAIQNQVGSVLTATGGTGRSLTDTAQTGSFQNDGVFTLALDAPTNLLTLSPGTFTNTNAIHVNTGILALNATGSYTGLFDGTGTLRFSGGTQELLSGASVTTSTVEVTGGALSIQPGASFAVGSAALSNGTLSVVDAATTASAGSLSMSGGTLAGAGAFEASGPSAWNGGTMSGSGATRALGGMTLGGGAAKLFAGTRTLVLAGSSSWTAGGIALGSGGATLRTEPGAELTVSGVTGRSLSDTGDSGVVENLGHWIVNLDDAASQVTLSPGAIENDGTFEVQTGTLQLDTDYTQTAGATRLAGGTLTSVTALELQAGGLEGDGVIAGDVHCACLLAPGLSAGQLDVDGSLVLLPGAELRAEIGGLGQGTSHDFVPVSGSAALGGSLAVSFLSGFEDAIAPGDQLTILQAGAPLSGGFANAPSGARIVTTPGLGSFALSYGPGSPFGADRVVLHDFLPYAPAITFNVVGSAQGGTIDLEVEGVHLAVVTTPGQTAASVAAALAAAINASPELAALGVVADASGASVATNGAVDSVPVVTDPGLVLVGSPSIPVLPGAALGLLGALLVSVVARLGPKGAPAPRHRRA